MSCIRFEVPVETKNPTNQRERMERLSIPEPNTGCWLWIGATMPGGYGKVWFGGRTVPAHRLALALACGGLDDGVMALHSCDQTACVNPAHLRPGTHAENMLERNSKGRQARGARHPRLRGSQNGNARLTEDDVREIRAAYAGGQSQQSIAAGRGIGQMTVSHIVRRKTWRRVP